MQTETSIIILYGFVLLISIIRGFLVDKSLYRIARTIYSILWAAAAAVLWNVVGIVLNTSIVYDQPLGTIVVAMAAICSVFALKELWEALIGKVPPQKSTKDEDKKEDGE